MVDLKDLKINKQKYLTAFSNKNIFLDHEVNQVLKLYDHYLDKLSLEEKDRFALNQITKEIKSGQKPQPALLTKAKKLSISAKKHGNQKKLIMIRILAIASYFPNPAGEKEIIGKNEANNKVIATFLDSKKSQNKQAPHWETLSNHGLILEDEASYISGSRHVIYHQKAAEVIKALECFMLEEHLNNGYILIEPPVVVNEVALYNTGQLPKFANDLYKLENGQYLIPTAEVPLTNLGANKIYDQKDLPIKFVAATQCFRKEAGAAGKDTRGLIRLHQFRKVELVKISQPSTKEIDFKEILDMATSILIKLELPYRTVALCTGDISFAAEKTVDIEVWMSGINKYREISSVSSFGQFQSRRMKSRFKTSSNQKELTTTFNASALAIGRTFAAIVENCLQPNGKIKVPKALLKHLSFTEF